MEGFQSALERKLFTYSALSATISYLGALLGFRTLHDAATDARVLSWRRTFYASRVPRCAVVTGTPPKARQSTPRNRWKHFRMLVIPIRWNGMPAIHCAS